MGKRSTIVVLGFLAATTLSAAEIQVASIPGVKAAMDTLTPAFEASAGDKILWSYEIYAVQKARIDAGQFDVAIFARAQMDQLAASGKIAPGTLRDIARTSIGVAVRTGAPKPALNSVDDFKSALLGAKSVTYTKESATGAYITDLLSRLGLAEQLRGKLILQPGGDMTTPAVAEGKAELGIVLVSDILRNRGAELVGPLPATLQNYVVQTAGVGAASQRFDAAARFIAFLRRLESGKVFASTGLEPLQ